MKRWLAAGTLGAASLVALLLMGACSGAEPATSDEPGDARVDEATIEPDVTFYVVAYHWGWGVFDSEGRELDGINVPEGTAVELIVVNDAAEEAISRLPARVAAAINAIEWDGLRTRAEIAAGRLPDPATKLGLALEEVMAHDDGDEEAGGGHGDGDEGSDGGHDDGAEEAGGGHDDGVEEAADAHDEGATEEADGGHDDSAAAPANLAAWQTPWLGEQRELQTHGLLVPWYGTVARLEPDASQPFRNVFIADRPGAFEFVCTVYCGYGHQYQPREMLFVEAAQAS